MRIGVHSIGVFAPGWPDWQTAQQDLRQNVPYELLAPVPSLSPELLLANERRRTTSLNRLALQAALDAVRNAPHVQKVDFPTVFASSCGDLTVVDNILSALLTAGKPVSPTRFHNSVHNAPAGYWSIATGTRASSSSISAFDGSFAAGLLDAATQVIVENKVVLLVSYDEPPPPPLFACRPLKGPFGVALLLGQPNSGQANIDIDVVQNTQETELDDTGLEALRRNNPAARALTLLKPLARAEQDQAILPYLFDRQLRVTISPC